MKKKLATLIVCVFAVIIYLKDGTIFNADKIVSLMQGGVIVETCSVTPKTVDKEVPTFCKRMWVPEQSLIRVIFDIEDTESL